MDRKGQYQGVVGAAVGIVTLIILIIIGILIANPLNDLTLDDYTTATAVGGYATDFSANRIVNFTLTNYVPGAAGSLRVSHQNTSNVTNISIGSTAIGSLTNVGTAQTFAVPAALMNVAVVRFNFTVTGTNENITDINLSYGNFTGCNAYYDLCQSAEASVDMQAAAFSILPILAILVAAATVIGVLVVLSRQ